MTVITQEHIENLVKRSKIQSAKVGRKTTVVCLTLPNGFEIVETAACIDPDNYNHEIGEKIALDRIENKVWLLEGYLLQQGLFE